MSLQYIQPQQTQQKSSGILGTLGMLATLGGTALGMPWLSTLGMGMSGVDSLMNGGGSSTGSTQAAVKTGGALGELLKGIKTGTWENPADGNPASGQPGDDTSALRVREALSQPTDEELAQRWGGYPTLGPSFLGEPVDYGKVWGNIFANSLGSLARYRGY